MFLNNQQVTEEIKKEIKQFLETNDNENMTTQKPMLLLLLSHFSHVRLCAPPETAAHQASLSTNLLLFTLSLLLLTLFLH